MRSAFARDLFRNEQYKLFQMETRQRDLLKQKVNNLLDNMDISRDAPPELVALFHTLLRNWLRCFIRSSRSLMAIMASASTVICQSR